MFEFALLLAAASVSEQMAPARDGLEQCQMPDAVSKVCYSLSKIVQDGPSAYTFKTETVIDPAMSIIGKLDERTFVDGTQLCEVMKADGGDTMAFSHEGRPLAPADAARYRAPLHQSYAALAGHKMCTEVVPNDESTVRVIATVDGKRVPTLDYLMKWVSRADGWRVAP